jgi:gliding motility-associated-like protein
MYEVTQPEVCFMIRAFEISNPYTSDGESSSQIVCTPITERITVPTVFTPDNNSVNDLFRPVLSYTPLSYKLVITDMKRRTVFETTDFNESWDGSNNGVPQPEGVYMWFLKAKTPSGREVTRTGTVTIVHNR